MARVDLSKYDATEHQKNVLDYVLNNDISSVPQETGQIPVEDARMASSQYRSISKRTTIRILFISQDTSLLNQAQQTLDGYLNLSEIFDEVHIVVMQEGAKARNPVLRVSANVWLYVVTARHWALMPFSALKLIKEQLFFATGFRPDLIVARDAYESALVAQILGKRYHRPTQLHVLEDFTSADFLKRTSHPKWRLRLARHFTKGFHSVRTETDQIKKIIGRLYPKIPDLATLPRFNNYQGIMDTSVIGLGLKDKYPQFVFTMIYFGALNYSSSVYQVIDAVRFILRNPHIALVIVGDGPARKEFEKRSKIFAIDKQVIFEPKIDNLATYIKTADVVIVSDIDNVGDDFVIQAAVLGTPIIASRTALRSDLFIDGESALLYEAGDSIELTKKISQLLDDFILRKQLVIKARQVVQSRLHEDPEVYRLAYRASVEQGLFLEEVSASEVTEKSIPESIPVILENKVQP